MNESSQSSDQIVKSTESTEDILASGTATLTAVPMGGGIEYYGATELIDLGNLNYDVVVPEAVVYVRGIAGDGSTLYDKAPYIKPSIELSAGGFMEISQIVSYRLYRGSPKFGGYELGLAISLSSSLNGDTITVDWKIKNTIAAPFS